jgi:mycothiol system anti-sigma-R factor
MSCGNPHEIDCAKVLAHVYLYLDGEIAGVYGEQIRHHLDECAPCLRAYGLEQLVKAIVARSCGCEVAPAELRSKVLTRLAQVRLEIDQLEFRVD